MPAFAIAAMGEPLVDMALRNRSQPGPIAWASSNEGPACPKNSACARYEWAPPEWIEISMSATSAIARQWAWATRSLG